MSTNYKECLALQKFADNVPEILDRVDYSEVYGYDFRNPQSEWCPAHWRILQNFLTANDLDIEPSCKQLEASLKWRKEFRPLRAGGLEKHSSLFDQHIKIVTVKDQVYLWINFKLFEKTTARKTYLRGPRAAEFLRWRISVMERSVAMMNLSSENPINLQQVIYDFSDYPGFALLGLDSDTRKIWKLTLTLIAKNYPGIIGDRYFVDTPSMLSWIFVFMQLRLGQSAGRKFKSIKHEQLASKVGNWVSKKFGGEGPSDLDELNCEQESVEECVLRIKECGLYHYKRDFSGTVKADTYQDSTINTSADSNVCPGEGHYDENTIRNSNSNIPIAYDFQTSAQTSTQASSQMDLPFTTENLGNPVNISPSASIYFNAFESSDPNVVHGEPLNNQELFALKSLRHDLGIHTPRYDGQSNENIDTWSEGYWDPNSNSVPGNMPLAVNATSVDSLSEWIQTQPF